MIDSHIKDSTINKSNRTTCPNCKKSYALFCPTCYIHLSPIHPQPPNITLPVNLILYRHPSEKIGKTTTPPVKILAPSQTNLIIHDFYKHGNHSLLINCNHQRQLQKNIENSLPDKFTKLNEQIPLHNKINLKRTLLLYPTVNAKRLDDIDKDSFDTLIVVDGTWSQAKTMADLISKECRTCRHDECHIGVAKLDDGTYPRSMVRLVKIDQQDTLFWRHQT